MGVRIHLPDGRKFNYPKASYDAVAEAWSKALNLSRVLTLIGDTGGITYNPNHIVMIEEIR